MKEHYEMSTELKQENGAYQFCSMSHMGGGMNMYMDGFQFSLSQSSDAPCLNLFLPQWTLHSRLRFFTGMLGVVALGIGIEGVSSLRSKYLALAKIESERREISVRVQVLMTLLHGLQACIGYILMLATMTYSIELFVCAVLGLCIGNFIFRRHKTIMSSNSSNPCCDLLEDKLALNEPLVYGSASNESFGCDDVKDDREEFESSNDNFGCSVLEKRRKKHVIL